jgi:hypothetical protein
VSGETDKLLEQVRRGLRASRDRRGDYRDDEFVRQLAVEGLVACDRIEAALKGRPRPDFDPHLDYPERFSDGPY